MPIEPTEQQQKERTVSDFVAVVCTLRNMQISVWEALEELSAQDQSALVMLVLAVQEWIEADCLLSGED